MISSMHIHNFQSHKDTKLELVPGVNVILGPTDSGKTAVIRAFRWLVENRPVGEAFRSTWGGDTSVRLRLENDVSIGRARLHKENSYRLGDSKFKAIRTEVPKEIQDALNLTGINFQWQQDRPFLLNASPGEVAQHFNRVAHLDVIDRCLKNVKKWIRALQVRGETARHRLAELQESLKGYDHLDDLEDRVTELEKLDKKRTSLLADAEELEQTISSIQSIQKELAESSWDTELEELVNEIAQLMKARNAVAKKAKNLTGHLGSIYIARKALHASEDELKAAQAKFEDEFPSTCPLCGTCLV